MELETIFSSYKPIDCYILKGRLECEGIDCFIYDANFVWVFPFRAVAIGGVKLKVPKDQIEIAEKIISLVKEDILVDEVGEYNICEVFENEIIKQDEILKIKSLIRNDPSLLDNYELLNSIYLSNDELTQIFESGKEFKKQSDIKFNFSLEHFWGELFDFDRSIFKYLRPRTIEYYVEKELVDNYINPPIGQHKTSCPKCKSSNVSYNLAIDYKWDLIYLILGLILLTPFPILRSKYHCFECGNDFNYRKIKKNNLFLLLLVVYGQLQVIY